MIKRYLVTGNWIDKANGKPMSGIAEISGGISKATGKPFEMAKTDNRETLEGTYPVGTILTANTQFSAQVTPPAANPFGEVAAPVKPSK